MTQQTLVLIPRLKNTVLWSAVASALRGKAAVVTPTFSAQDSVTAMADVVLACTPPGPPFALAGFSMGDWVAQKVVRRAGDRVSRLAFISSGAGARQRKRTRARAGRPDTIRASRVR
jgi:pimeloyl-ACP methyl ester carboxylesterase